MIFNIQRFSIHDGPGIRTGVFFKGCPLACQWCHNPEGIRAHPELGYDERLCIHCLACASACERGCHAIKDAGLHHFKREGCDVCGACAHACPAGALRIIGRDYDCEEVTDLLLRDRPFFETSGGGLTLTGGEAAMQPEFALTLLKSARRQGIHTCMETSGEAPLSSLLALAEASDAVLYDIKELDPALHKTFTGLSNRRILENLRALNRARIPLVLRCPIVPDKNLRAEHFQAIASLACSLPSVREIELIPYHPLGLNKYRQIGMRPKYQNEGFLRTDDLSDGAAIIREQARLPVSIT